MPKVLLLHTGGTLGMRGEPLKPDAFSMVLTETVPEISQLAELEVRIPFNLDSSDIGPTHWSQLAQLIHQAHHDFDGFVIVHGTDTMAYTAGALSFALSGLNKPVIMTGAQRPLAALRTDARRNLVDAVDLATRAIPEVGICFDGLLLRGCRTTKSHANDYRAFESPGVEPLARLGVDIVIHSAPQSNERPYQFRPDFDSSVLALHIAPGMRIDMLNDMLKRSSLKGLVLSAYGSGTVPRQEINVAAVIEGAVDAGIDVLVVTQSTGRVDLSLYENSRALAEAGAISGGEMTIEAGVTKMMHALANFDNREQRRQYLMQDITREGAIGFYP